MTVKQIITYLLEMPMDSRVLLCIGKYSNGEYKYANPEYCINYEDGDIAICSGEVKSEKEFFEGEKINE